MKQQFTPTGANGPDSVKEWDARSYHAVSEPQFEWGQRVLATLPLTGDETVLDAGCGTGRLTALLADRVPRGMVVAIDRSHNMTVVAKETLSRESRHAKIALADLVHLPFRQAFDVVFSTATFHWIRDHETLFAELYSVLRSGGLLHAQCGGGPNLARLHERAHALMQRAEFATYFADWQEPWEYASADTTRERLRHAGFTQIDTSLEPAPFVFPDAHAYRVFVSTVVLRTFVAPLPEGRVRSTFLERIVEQAAGDNPAFELDYVRLNIRARRA